VYVCAFWVLTYIAIVAPVRAYRLAQIYSSQASTLGKERRRKGRRFIHLYLQRKTLLLNNLRRRPTLVCKTEPSPRTLALRPFICGAHAFPFSYSLPLPALRDAYSLRLRVDSVSSGLPLYHFAWNRAFTQTWRVPYSGNRRHYYDCVRLSLACIISAQFVSTPLNHIGASMKAL